MISLHCFQPMLRWSQCDERERRWRSKIDSKRIETKNSILPLPEPFVSFGHHPSRWKRSTGEAIFRAGLIFAKF